MAETRIVVIGAGVAGLTTALLLSRNKNYKITVAAKHMPGDYDIEYASPWAGANYLPVAVPGTDLEKWEADTWPELEKLATLHPEAGIHFQAATLYNRTKDFEDGKATALAASTVSDPWYKAIVPNFGKIPKDQLPAGYDNGNTFTSVCINTAIYLPWLLSRCLESGVIFKRAVFDHISEASRVHHSGEKADVIINCTGLSAGKLGGVEDRNMVPARGQIVLVRNEGDGVMHATSGTDFSKEDFCYTMTRAAGGGTILGGCYQIGSWDSQPDPNLAIRIMRRAVDICPALTDGKGIEHLSIIRHGVGLRPLRIGGTRVEKERIDTMLVIHNYGHGGYGYQSSYGCSQAVVKLLEEVLSVRAKL
ncbi:hypothetical protein JMJ35_005579 [Cladonia borealis]|uniref:FAD dependent oxidoreductase domain-containing protein n=1 Tax=Cladonia borealis TaxID=184061 RepID=A0AA39R2X0_9LECA|nr:hypothetical protein JMJ35_005579 [Cladonia borealis]